MAQIEINCIGQTAIYTNTPEIFSGDVNIDTVKFTFDEAWNGYDMKTAVFYNNPKDTYPVMLDENDVAVIPEAVMADKCKLSIGVFGTNANGDVKTSKILTYNIGKGAISNDLEATTPPEFWEQLLTRQINFENNMDNKFDTLSSEFDTLSDDVDTVEAIAKGRNQALAYTSYSEMVTALNSMGSDELNRGQNIYIGAVGVPDLWVYSVETENAEYTYVDDDTFVESLNKDVTVQVGYYKLAQLETQKVDVGGITKAIDNLENDVDTLESGLASERLLWNISDEIYTELTEANIPLPSDLGSYIFNIFYYDEKIYLVGTGGSSDYLSLFIYESGEWTRKTFWSEKVTVAYVTMEELNGDIYIALNYGSTPNGFLKKYSNSNKALTTITDKSASYSFALAKDVEKNILYIARLPYGSSQKVSIATHNGTTISSYTTINATSYSNTSILSAFLIDNILHLSLSGNYLNIFDISDFTFLGGNGDGELGFIRSVCTYKNIKYMTINNQLYNFKNYNAKRLDVKKTWITNYKGSFLTMYTDTKTFNELKLYKVATSYATKGTKIYLADNSFAISDNLEPTDNGYIVTADGEVKIGIYE